MIKINNLSVGYRNIEKLHSLSAVIDSDKITGIIGPNGSGKSTLLKSIANIIAPIDGDIIIDQKKISEYSGKELARKVAYMPQSRNVSSITAEAMVLHGRFPYLSYPRRYTKNDMQIVYEALNCVGIYEQKDKNIESMSGGERQKVYLAMTIAQDTDIVLLDEPTTYLDIDCQLDVWQTAKKMKEMGKTIVIVSHDIIQSLRYTDDIIIMKDGNIIAHGDTENIYESGILSDIFNIKITKDNCKRYYYM